MRSLPKLLILLSTLAIAGCLVESHYVSFSPSPEDKLKIHRPLDLTSEVPLTSLHVDVPYCDVTVTSSPAIKSLHLTGELLEASPNEAQIEFTPTGPHLVSHSDPPARFSKLNLEIPPGLDLALSTSSGNLTVHDLPAAMKSVSLHSAYGSISLTDSAPIQTLSLDAASGNIKLARLQSFHTLTAHSAYGSLALSDLTGDAGANLRATAASGNITLSGIHHTALSAESAYGSISLDLATDLPSVSLASSSGNVRATSLAGAGDLSLKSSYGSATLSAVPGAASINIHCASGNITLNGVSAPQATLDTSYGSIHLADSSFASLNTSCTSGHITQQNVHVGPAHLQRTTND